MRFGSVCSGVEAASIAWQPLGWKAQFFSEIDKFPSAVLNHHYPDVPNYGDMTKFKEWNAETIDLLVGGTPCQSFSIAGLRKGMEDPRGNLSLTYIAMADRFKPKWVVWENVPGVLSSNKGRDFGAFLSALGTIGYGWAYRVLDAQYFGVAQRRRRVFVVGRAGGDWESAAEVLFESKSLSGNPAPSREAGEKTADTTGRSTSWSIMPMNSGKDYKARKVEVAQPIMAAGPVGGNQGGDYILTYDMRGHHDPQPSDTVQLTTRNCAMVAGDTPLMQEVLAFPTGLSGTQSASTPNLSPSLSVGHTASIAPKGSRVRRLTPIECERLQGFPDNFTQIPYGKKSAEDCPVGPRYKAMGNSMAVPVMRWIGERIHKKNNQ